MRLRTDSSILKGFMGCLWFYSHYRATGCRLCPANYRSHTLEDGMGKEQKIRVLDLFSGIGNFSLGLRWAGMRTVAFCEIEKFPRSVLKKHWPDIPIFQDVRDLHVEDLPEAVDLICGGYPCQPFSYAGERRGTRDHRHLWPEVMRLIREFHAAGHKPDWCLFENVAGHVTLGLDQVLFDLEREGYSVWTIIVPACAVNAPHRRDRVWIIANADKQHGNVSGLQTGTIQQQKQAGLQGDIVAHTSRQLLNRGGVGRQAGRPEPAISGGYAPHSNSSRRQRKRKFSLTGAQAGVERCCGKVTANPYGEREQQQERIVPGRRGRPCDEGEKRGTTKEWLSVCPVCRTDDGAPFELDRGKRLKALGNSLVPQIPELIGRAIVSSMQEAEP